jgi:hypothetical protein
MRPPYLSCNYFERNAARVRYPKFRKQGLFVGSGVIGAGCRTLTALIARSLACLVVMELLVRPHKASGLAECTLLLIHASALHSRREPPVTRIADSRQAAGFHNSGWSSMV